MKRQEMKRHERLAAMGVGILVFNGLVASVGVFIDGTAGGLLPSWCILDAFVLGVGLCMLSSVGYVFSALSRSR